MIYFVIIGLPIFLAFLSDHSRGLLSYTLFGLALFVPCLFAGARDATIGTDVMTYGYWTFKSATRSSLLPFLSSYADISAFGFNLISWIIARAGSFPLYLGTLQALVVVPLCAYSKKLFPQSSWIAMALYMLLLFPFSLNAMKQMIAVALCVLTFQLADERRPLLFAGAVLIIAFLFHQTAIVALIYYPAVVSIRSIGSNRAFFGRFHGLVIAAITVVLFFLAFIFGNRLVSSLSFLKESYSYQANSTGSRLNYTSLVLLTGISIIYVIDQYFSDKKPDIYDARRLFGLFSIVGAFAVQLNMVANSLLRFSYYALSFLPLYGSAVYGEGRRGRLLSLFLTVLSVAYFYQAFVVNGGNQIFPYTSSILGIS